MREVVLQRLSHDGKLLKAVFYPDQGMNLASYKKGEIEAIDQSTLPLFEERLSGLGPIIGPHFYHRKDDEIPFVPDETMFPHIARVKAAGSTEPFSHGIGRYVSWNYTASDTTVHGYLSGLDTFNGVTLAALEGFDFQMEFKAHLTNSGLEITFDVESKGKPSIAGLHYYYALDGGSGEVQMRCQETYNDMGVWKKIPEKWKKEDHLYFNLNEESDYGFRPNRDDYTGDAYLQTKNHSLHIHYKTENEENAFQLYHPKGASFVCIEPVTAMNPRDAKQKENHLKATVEILEK